MLWHTCLLRGNGLKSTDKKKVSCFVFNLINVKCSFTSFYWKIKYRDTYRIMCHVSWYVSDWLGIVSFHPYKEPLLFSSCVSLFLVSSISHLWYVQPFIFTDFSQISLQSLELYMHIKCLCRQTEKLYYEGFTHNSKYFNNKIPWDLRTAVEFWVSLDDISLVLPSVSVLFSLCVCHPFSCQFPHI